MDNLFNTFIINIKLKLFNNINNKNSNLKSSKDSFVKDKVVSITYEEIGLFPRSFSRVLDRFLKQIFSDVDNLVIQEYRFYRYLFLTTIKTIFILLFVPFIVNLIAKSYLVRPITEYFWNNKQTEIFLNSYEQKHAFVELQDFEEKLYFDSLILGSQHGKSTSYNKLTQDTCYNDGLHNPDTISCEKLKSQAYTINNGTERSFLELRSKNGSNTLNNQSIAKSRTDNIEPAIIIGTEFHSIQPIESYNNINNNINNNYRLNSAINQNISWFQQKLQEKTVQLAIKYNNHSIEAITNFFADLLSLLTLIYLLFSLEIQINITKSFLLEVFFGLDDSKKSLLILLVTDLLVGYHSSNLWELFFEFIFNHYGIPESQTGIFLLVATLPVLLDVLFKYLIFRHLNRSSPATVATYHAIIE